MAYEKGVSVADVAQDGPGLAFVVYPEAISRMPAPQLWAIFFFIMMASLGFGSQFSIVECVMSAFTDEFPNYLRGKWESICFRSIVVLTSFLLGLPMVAKVSVPFHPAPQTHPPSLTASSSRTGRHLFADAG